MRTKSLLFVLILAFFVLSARLFYLQIIKGKEYRTLADSNRIKAETIYAPRGIIYDRNGYPLVRNIPGFRIRQDNKIKVLSREEALKMQLVSKEELPAQGLEIDSLREYLYPEEFAHVLGYIGEGEKAGDLTGKTGLEEKYQDVLSGVDGKKLIEVDAGLSPKRFLGEVKPISGLDLKTTLDLGLQRKAYEAIKEVERGSVVASDPRTGEVLILVSKPSFDPNLFTLGKSGVNVQEILSDREGPLFNRAIAGSYPPGSIFKIITAAAGLEEGVITRETEIEDVGILQVGRFSFPNWYFTQYGKLEGFLSVVRAIRRSNDIFFYKVAEMVGFEKLREMAKKFKVGEKLGIDLKGEAGGLLPSEEWKQNFIGDKWYLGDTYHLGIGQGYLLVTPLQVNAWTSVVANGGEFYQPRLVKNNPITQSSNNPMGKNKDFLSKETINLIKEGMKEACSPGGTGWPLFKFKIKNEKLKIDNRNFFLPEEATVSGKTDDWVYIPVACKTGTAEFGDPKNRTHAWFTVFAPVEDPQIVVTVLVESGGEGSNVAAPIAKEILEEWFGR